MYNYLDSIGGYRDKQLCYLCTISLEHRCQLTAALKSGMSILVVISDTGICDTEHVAIVKGLICSK